MIIDFNYKEKINNAGNKAKFLIELKNNNFNVPDGFVVDSDTYSEEISNNKLDKEITKCLNRLNKENISEISKEIITLFDSFKFSNNTISEIEELLSESKLYAVRSSGTKEDLDNYSFAGQYQTFLNVKKEDVLNKIIGCYKSMFSEVILSYFINNNISTDCLKMSVIVQEMVSSEYSGICFTVDPISGNDKTMLIEIGEGLGENIVSGQNKPEQYYFNWYENKCEIPKNNHYIDEKLLRKISIEFSKIMQYFGYPCDIEFAIVKNEMYILQARKITKIEYQGYKDLWSTADFKDGGVSATICTPYMWSLYEYIWEYTLRKFILDSKILKDKDLNKKLGDMFYARCYWNLSVVKKAMSQVVGYKEREFDSEYGIKMNYEGDGETTKLTLKSIKDIIRMAIAQKKILNTRNKNAEKYKADLLDKYYNYKNNYDRQQINDIKKSWYELTHEDYLQSESTYFWQIFINTIHQSLYKDGLLKYVSESEYLTLLGSIEDISHLLPFYDMWDISRKIRNNNDIFKYWQEKEIEEIIKDIDSETRREDFNDIRNLIKNYGYHSDKELDVTYKCYYEDITPFINTLKDMVLLEDKYSPAQDKKQGKEAYEKILENIKTKVSSKKYKKIQTKVLNMRKMLWWREEFRDVSTRFYYLIRVYTIELAKLFVQDKIIENIDDIWFLKVGDIWDYIDSRITNKDIKEIIQKNKLYYNSYRNYMSENEIGQNLGANNEEKNNENAIKGLGANNGKVVGTARVIETFDEIDRLQKNDILVTKFTDTGWTPKFAILSGIVTEYGGILCHAAIVSREYGIPAIVSCHEALTKIKDGQKIMIDGATGIIKIVEE